MVRLGVYSDARQSVGGPLSVPSLAQNLQACGPSTLILVLRSVGLPPFCESELVYPSSTCSLVVGFLRSLSAC